MIGVIIKQEEEVKMRMIIALWFLDLDDWFAEKNIFLNWFTKDKDNHVSWLARVGFRIGGLY